MKVGMWGFRILSLFLLLVMVIAEEIGQNRRTERISGGSCFISCFRFGISASFHVS